MSPRKGVGAGDGLRTRYLNLGKLILCQGCFRTSILSWVAAVPCESAFCADQPISPHRLRENSEAGPVKDIRMRPFFSLLEKAVRASTQVPSLQTSPRGDARSGCHERLISVTGAVLLVCN
jgi:hypothetical protein